MSLNFSFGPLKLFVMLVLVIFLSLQWLVNCVTYLLIMSTVVVMKLICILKIGQWFYLFNTAFFWPRTCPRPRKIVLVLVLKHLSSASRICPRLTSLTLILIRGATLGRPPVKWAASISKSWGQGLRHTIVTKYSHVGGLLLTERQSCLSPIENLYFTNQW